MKKIAVAMLLSNLIIPTGTAWANHDEGYCDDNGDCYSQNYDQNYGSRDDRNRNRNRDRGAFSPGPFRDSPVDAFNGVCMPGATCYYDGNRGEKGKDQRPSS